ncbi:CBS domain-containing protein [Streptomyces populi]|uniref:CBS domain-containing protein n=1 Tax=Streptomyces populi TaxID=2058924 RepID=UPI0035E229A3
MTRHGIERLPVVDEKDRLVDIVSRRDLLQVFLRSAEGIWQAVRREVFADALRLSPQISEGAVHDGAVTLTGQLGSGAAPPSRWVRRARRTVSSTSWTTSPAASTTGTHGPPDRPGTEWPTTGRVGHEPTDPTHWRPALRPRGGKGPRRGPHQRRDHHHGPGSTGPGGAT